MNRHRGPLSHVRIDDDGDESDWDTVTDVKDGNNTVASQPSIPEESPRDDTSYQQTSLNIPFINDNKPPDQNSESAVGYSDDDADTRPGSVASMESHKGVVVDIAHSVPEPIPDTNFTPKKMGHFIGEAAREPASKSATKYVTSEDRSEFSETSASFSKNIQFHSPREGLQLSPKSTNTVMETRPPVSEHSIVISDSGANEVGAVVISSEHQTNGNNSRKMGIKKWTSMLPTPKKNGKTAAKLAAVVDGPLDEEFDGDNYYELIRHNRWQYEFIPSSGAQSGFMLPRPNPSPRAMRVVERVEAVTQRGLAEAFSFVRLIFVVFIAFFIELSKTIIGGVVQPVLVGTITLFGSYLLQPVLVALFNHIIAPSFSFVHNVFSAVFRSVTPLFKILETFCASFVELFRSIRLVDVNMANRQGTLMESPKNDVEKLPAA